MPAARAWSVYEGACSTLLPSPETVRAFSADALALGLARMEAHYFRNNIFLPENYLLDNIDRIRNIPTFIVQGRYDLVCPVRSADDLSRVWPQAALHHHPRRRPLRHGARHPLGAGRGDGSVQERGVALAIVTPLTSPRP